MKKVGFVFLCLMLFVFPLSLGKAQATIIYSSGTLNQDFGNGFGDLSSNILISDSFIIADMTVSLDISHTWVGDLLITLTSPGAEVMTLVDRPGVPPGGVGNSDNLAGVYRFTDGAATSIPETSAVSPIPTADYLPDTTVGDTFASLFVGEDIFGTWTLDIYDLVGLDTGTLVSWEIAADPVPEPATMLLLGSGILGLAAFRRRFRKK